MRMRLHSISIVNPHAEKNFPPIVSLVLYIFSEYSPFGIARFDDWPHLKAILVYFNYKLLKPLNTVELPSETN